MQQYCSVTVAVDFRTFIDSVFIAHIDKVTRSRVLQAGACLVASAARRAMSVYDDD